MNKVILVGRLASDPIAGNSSVTPRANFTIAVDGSYSKAEQAVGTVFIPCVAWNAQANFINNYLKKGSLVSLEGHIERRTYLSNKTGQNATSFNVVVEKLSTLARSNAAPKDEFTTNQSSTVSLSDIFPESNASNPVESESQTKTEPKFSQEDDLEWFENLTKKDEK